jgi:hypothetical protein
MVEGCRLREKGRDKKLVAGNADPRVCVQSNLVTF